ncbi:E3 ubiquitin-protein ligase MARCHF7 [Alligator mississippiensis]|uniref:E3 ubiquitin-protein ligase MARCHF7 n=1 Tax=Alligator mississippiensis TaxID=8496 RepID=UPI0003D0C798|nr:E3 ubiquitin-protein ligase MARCHF7 [Alligator mississippiensis]XP_059583332.1 E3 ubiquitin-protein ligase MARCHF7 [Alligator mississippiensis]XP_059583333.1 E3 ubiquitin-protein ligase MARCHF7 [Alligator mississippiensis]
MESKPSRIPRRISVQPSSSSLSARTLAGSSLSDTYDTRDSSLRLESGCQDSHLLHGSSRNWGIGEREAHETPWKLTTSSPTRYSGTLDRPWSGRFLGSRNRLSASSSSPFTSTWYGESERTQGAYSRIHNQQQDTDSKRPKLSYTSTSSGRSNGLNGISDSTWRYSQVPRSSSVVLGTLGTELVRERRELERRTDPSTNSLVDYSHRNSDFSSSTYLQDRSASSYAQGARPKDNSLGTLRLNTSMNRQLPSEQQPSVFSRDSSRSSSRSSYSSREMESPQRNIQPEVTPVAIREETPSTSSSERVTASQRSLSEPTSDTEGRRTTRQLLSRLASSMSSTFFSRRSSQESLNARSLDSEDSRVVPRVQASTPSSTNASAIPEVPDSQTSEASQGFSFLRRRWGLSGVSQNHSSDSDAESYRQESENRNTGSWLSSSLRNRCTPLFSRRRREGRDESARTSTSDIPARSLHLFRRRELGEETPLEAHRSSSGGASNRPPTPAVSGSPTATASAPDSAHRSSSGMSGILPGSLFRFAVPPALGSSLSDNLMITVDIIPSGWNLSDGQENDKSKIPPSRDPERLQKIKESLLLEDSEDEEGDLCRICQMSSASSTNLLIEPCKCTGSLQYVHQECMKKWLQSKINSGSSLEAVTTCELCKEKLHLNLEDFDIHELYRAHANEQADYEFISSGLYLVVLLHLCEQRFSDMLGTASEASTRVRFINLARTLQAHMEDIETSEDDSED